MGTVISVLIIATLTNIIFKKYNILIDQTNISKHKSFINEHKNIPLSGGIIFFLILLFFLPEDYKYFTILFFFIFLLGLLSDLDILHSPKFRIIFLLFTIVHVYFHFSQVPFVINCRVSVFAS